MIWHETVPAVVHVRTTAVIIDSPRGTLNRTMHRDFLNLRRPVGGLIAGT